MIRYSFLGSTFLKTHILLVEIPRELYLDMVPKSGILGLGDGPRIPIRTKTILARILNRLTIDEVLPINRFQPARMMILTDYNQSSESN